MLERRRHSRRTARLVLGIETDSRKDRAGLTCDVSPSGLAFRSPSRFEVGELVKLRFRDPVACHRNIEVFGEVVRTGTQTRHYLFKHVAAVRFRGQVDALASIGTQRLH